jgi:hypothetical protein
VSSGTVRQCRRSSSAKRCAPIAISATSRRGCTSTRARAARSQATAPEPASGTPSSSRATPSSNTWRQVSSSARPASATSAALASGSARPSIERSSGIVRRVSAAAMASARPAAMPDPTSRGRVSTRCQFMGAN